MFASVSRATIIRNMSSSQFPITAAITKNLTKAFAPTHLEVINESYKHKVPRDSETHFRVVVVSERFNSTKSLVERHRLVNEALDEQLAGGVHALSIVAKTPQQWQDMQEQGKTVSPTPNCKGGDGTFAK